MICRSENVAISQQMRIFDWEHENSPPVVVFDQRAAGQDYGRLCPQCACPASQGVQ